MRVFNLTDVKTAVLEQRGLVEQHIAVAGRMINPGEYADVEDSASSRANVADLVRIGALAIGQLPPPYVLARQQAEAASGRLAAQISQRVNLQETKVAGEPPPGPPAEGETTVAVKHDPSSEKSDESSAPRPPAPPVAEDPPPLQPPKNTGKKSGNR